MSRRLVTFLFGTVAAFLVTIPVLAKTNSNNTIKATIDLDSSAKLGSKTLTPGEYRVIAEGNQVKFERDGSVVASAPCTMKPLSKKADETAYVLDKGRLIEIQVSGKTEAIDLPS
jgi:hypothetical protein